MPRMTLSLINRGQIRLQDFSIEAGGAVNIKPEARKPDALKAI